MTQSVHAAARAALMICDPEEKRAATAAIGAAWKAGQLFVEPGENDGEALLVPGRPEKPELVDPLEVPRRRPATPEGHAALLHAIAHIEFNAINLALDCVARYRGFPAEFHSGWVRVAVEEAYHFSLLRERLRELGYDYGDFPAHNGLWLMACRTAADPLARMALVPRVLEARGLDATPPIMDKLRRIGDSKTLGILDIILRDEIGHVALGDAWFRTLCAQRGLEPEQTYIDLIEAFDAPWPMPPLHEAARLQAGFTPSELRRLAQGPGGQR